MIKTKADMCDELVNEFLWSSRTDPDDDDVVVDVASLSALDVLRGSLADCLYFIISTQR